MSIRTRDIKLLWGRSGNRCAICKQELAYTADPSNQNILVGQQAHIVAQVPNGPRGKSNLSEHERDAYSNLLLLCANHHTEIDTDTETYTIEKLHQIKQEHELWVNEQLSTAISGQRQAEDGIYANIIDAVVDALDLSNWENWSSFAVSSSNMLFPAEMINRTAFELRILIEKAIFNGRFPELEHAIATVTHVFLATINVFAEHSEEHAKYYQEIKFYTIQQWDEERYNSLLGAYQRWKQIYLDCFRDLARAINWFADVVRRDINPFFFSTEGRFVIVEGDFFAFYPCLYQFEDWEKEQMPTLILNKLTSLSTD